MEGNLCFNGQGKKIFPAASAALEQGMQISVWHTITSRLFCESGIENIRILFPENGVALEPAIGEKSELRGKEPSPAARAHPALFIPNPFQMDSALFEL